MNDEFVQFISNNLYIDKNKIIKDFYYVLSYFNDYAIRKEGSEGSPHQPITHDIAFIVLEPEPT